MDVSSAGEGYAALVRGVPGQRNHATYFAARNLSSLSLFFFGIPDPQRTDCPHPPGNIAGQHRRPIRGIGVHSLFHNAGRHTHQNAACSALR